MNSPTLRLQLGGSKVRIGVVNGRPTVFFSVNKTRSRNIKNFTSSITIDGES